MLEPARALAADVCESDFVPKDMRGNPPKVLAAIMYGREIGLEPMNALESITIVQGRPVLAAAAMRALIVAAGHQIRVVSSTDQRCLIRGRRAEDRSDPEAWQEFGFTVQEANRAGLTGKDNWRKYPSDMLLARATSRLAKAVFPDAIRGLSTREEMLDVETGEILPAPVTVQPPEHMREQAPAVQEAPPAARPPASRQRPAQRRQTQPASSRSYVDPRRQAKPTQVEAPPVDADIVEAEVIEAERVDAAPETAEPTPADSMITDGQRRRLWAGVRGLGMGKEEAHEFAADVLGVPVASLADLTKGEAAKVIDAVEAATRLAADVPAADVPADSQDGLPVEEAGS
jgi:hypothetical protein